MLDARDSRSLAALMRRVVRPGFGRDLKRVLHARSPFCTFLILSYFPDREPISHFHWIENPRLRATYSSQYLSGAYRLDPFYQIAMRPFQPGFYRLKDVAPDRFYSSEYYHRYYAQTGLCDEIGVMVGQSDGSVLTISISRDTRGGPFSRGEINQWRAFGPVLTELLRQHGEAVIVPGMSYRQVEQPGTAVLIRNFSRSKAARGLTRREAEISALILQGHSSLSISGLLGIATATVKVHRKNIYRKLGISSQAELFAHLHRALVAG